MTLDELKKNIKDCELRIVQICDFLKIEQQEAKQKNIEKLMLASDFWDNSEKAQSIMEELSSCKNIIEPYKKLLSEVDDFTIMLELVEDDEEMLEEADDSWIKLSKNMDKMELLCYLSGKFDKNNAYISIHAGAGGTESCDWALMLFRMYRRWFERCGYKDEIVEIQNGDEAGIKSVTIKVTGNLVYGYSKAEAGVHRLVRISPFDSNSRRHTSFACVDVFPELNDDVDIDIDESELRVDTYRSSGAGGQHVNKTDSAVRLTHIPTGLVAACQNGRSQHKNKAAAMQMLKAKLYEKQQLEQKEQASEIRGEKTEMGWGNQIRSYVLHPYQMVKDLRTSVETGNTSAVLDGDLNQFIEPWLKQFGGK